LKHSNVSMNVYEGSELPNLPKRFVAVDVLAWCGFVILISGGVVLSTYLFGQRVHISIGHWSYFFVPALCAAWLLGPKFTDRLSSARFIACLESAIQKRGALLPLCLLASVFFVSLLIFSWHRYLSFRGGWDLAIYANACANQMHSSLRDHRSLLADHFEPILLLLVPGCRVFDPAMFLLFTQVVAFIVGSFGIAKLALLKGSTPFTSVLAAGLYLSASGGLTLIEWDFHPYAFSLATIPWILVAIVSRRFLLLVLLAILHLSLKEHTGLFIAGLGIFLFFDRTRLSRAQSLLLAILGLITFFVVMKLVFPHFRGGEETLYFRKYYGYIGDDMKSFIVNSILKPHLVAKQLLQLDVIKYTLLLILCFPLVLIRPLYVLPILPVFMTNVLSSSPTLHSSKFHYDAEIFAWLFGAHILLMNDVRVMTIVKRPLLLWLLLLFLFGVGESPIRYLNKDVPRQTDIELFSALKSFQREHMHCKVATNDPLAPVLARLPALTLLDEEEKADSVVIAYPRGNRLWTVKAERIEAELSQKWGQQMTKTSPLIYDQDFRIWSRCPSATLQ
jgi:uncharacterized membrane protein